MPEQPEDVGHRGPSVCCHRCGWSVLLPFVDPTHVSIEPLTGWEIATGSVLCERCVSGWEPPTLERRTGQSFTGQVADAGGGQVQIVVSRDTESYPHAGERVIVEVIQ